MKTLTLVEFREQLKAQNVDKLDFALICPACRTVQSPRMLIQANAGANFEEVRKFIGFSCVGRFTGKGSPTDEKSKEHGCNWTLGGLFQIHELEVITEDGTRHPQFEPATAEQAQELASRLGASHE
ncbi:VVA0879 family protein [Enterobacter asburiae]|uniref:VVA0879 family protein n=1 Tax=Enterobacter asburiae TaxID=61645 RepID=UPI003EE613EA